MSAPDKSQVTTRRDPSQLPEPPVASEPRVDPSLSEGRKWATREDFLNAASHLGEEEVFVEGIGWLLLSEISGDARADIVGASATALQNGQLDVKSYQRSVLLAGVVDPSSPPGDRRPMFSRGDVERLMKVGGKKLLQAIDVIERLSAMGRYQAAAEGNSEATQNGAGTSE